MVSDDNNTHKAIRAVKNGTRDGVRETTRRMNERVAESFATGRDPQGRPWAPHAPSTLRQKVNDQILVESGDYRESWDAMVSEDGLTGLVGTDSELGPIHEHGVPENNLPARPMAEPLAKWAADELLEQEFESSLNRSLSSRGL